MELLLFVFVVFVVIALVGRAARKRAEREAARQEELAQAIERETSTPARCRRSGSFRSAASSRSC